VPAEELGDFNARTVGTIEVAPTFP
jgi:hypothetical protein